MPLSFPIAEEGRLLAGEPHRLGRMQCAPGGVGRIERVGAGRLAFDHAVVEGMTPPVDWTPATGTYQVNPDCTGQAELNIPGNPLSPLSIRFVIADEANLLLYGAVRTMDGQRKIGDRALQTMLDWTARQAYTSASVDAISRQAHLRRRDPWTRNDLLEGNS